jgi:hypothetical protein
VFRLTAAPGETVEATEVLTYTMLHGLTISLPTGTLDLMVDEVVFQ